MAELFKGLKQIERAREELQGKSFMAGLYLGKPDFELLMLEPETDAEKSEGESFCRKVEAFLKEHVDAREIERGGVITDDVIQGLLALGVFGMKIPREYGGLGFSHKNYGRVLTLIASWSNILALTVAVPQSIGIAMPIMLYGNQEQKDRYLPLVAKQEISAFALTEPDTGSDAANIQTAAILTDDDSGFVVNGEKLWCTNGAIARYITLIAKVPAKQVTSQEEGAWQPIKPDETSESMVHTAFILDMQTPGVEIKQRCQFAGCRGIANAHILLKDVFIPRENIIGQVGLGLKYALSILNIGRAVSIPAICLGMAKQAWEPTLDRLKSRYTFGEPLANRQTQRIRVGKMASRLFAMEALCELVWQMADQGDYDVRMEAAVAKIFCSEQTIRLLDDAQVIFGGAGYETAASKEVRGEPGFELEQLVRDATMYRIGEGATDVLRPFVAREALNFHLNIAGEALTHGLNFGRLKALIKFYVPWYLKLWQRRPLPRHDSLKAPSVRKMLRYVESRSRALARSTAYAMLIRRQHMQQDQGRQNRIEQIGEALFVLSACALHIQHKNRSGATLLGLSYWRTAKLQLRTLLRELVCNADRQQEQLGADVLKLDSGWLTDGVIRRGLAEYKK